MFPSRERAIAWSTEPSMSTPTFACAGVSVKSLALVVHDDRAVERLEQRAPQLGARGGSRHPADGHAVDRDALGDLVLTAGVVRVDPAGRTTRRTTSVATMKKDRDAHLLK